MKKLVCFGFMALALGTQAANNPPLNVFATATVSCSENTACENGWMQVRDGVRQTCVAGTQPSCQSSSCGSFGAWYWAECAYV